ncbi:MAG: 23S rRNA (pseudouridine(1915)-N(3))-methyltransferase RlmH [Gammaproteobacteria bacterium]
MHIYLIAVGQKMPAWVNQACDGYLKRLPHELQLTLIEVPLIKRGRNPDIPRIIRDEGKKVLQSIPAGCDLVALDVKGTRLSTGKLASTLDNWMQQGRDIAIVIGGPDGLADEVLQQARHSFSLSEMTFPHPLVRIIIVEQLYRAKLFCNILLQWSVT